MGGFGRPLCIHCENQTREAASAVGGDKLRPFPNEPANGGERAGSFNDRQKRTLLRKPFIAAKPEKGVPFTNPGSDILSKKANSAEQNIRVRREKQDS